jgi:hypothetical protein
MEHGGQEPRLLQRALDMPLREAFVRDGQAICVDAHAVAVGVWTELFLHVGIDSLCEGRGGGQK